MCLKVDNTFEDGDSRPTGVQNGSCRRITKSTVAAPVIITKLYDTVRKYLSNTFVSPVMCDTSITRSQAVARIADRTA